MLLMRSAVVHIALLAVETISAEGFHVYRHTVAFTESLYFTAQFVHYANHLMTDCYAWHGFWHAAMLYVQVAGADATQGHTDYCVGWFL